MTEYLSQFELNDIHITRKSLSFDEAVGVWLMHWSRTPHHTIAARFGTNGGRIAEILTEKKHVGSRDHAMQLRIS